MSIAKVQLEPLALERYRGVIPEGLYWRTQELGARMKGLRITHLNAVAHGGGVAVLLSGLVPLMIGSGLQAEWYSIDADPRFFQITKRLHNALQGAEESLSSEEKDYYEAVNRELAQEMRGIATDIWFVHDPQPLAAGAELGAQGVPAVWICHIDSSKPNPDAADFVLPWINSYREVNFSMPQYALPGIDKPVAHFYPPALDPFLPKNRELDSGTARDILFSLGMDVSRPIATQVSRFDRWKNPWGAVDAYRTAKKTVPDLQLALVGTFEAKDDPEAPEVYQSVMQYVEEDAGVHFFTDATQVGDLEVAAFQTASDAILQMSSREGFGLTVTEAMWHGTPVIACGVGGICLQIENGIDGFTASSIEEAASHLVEVLRDRDLAHRLGKAAKTKVKKKFLMPRLECDCLSIVSEVLSASATSPC